MIGVVVVIVGFVAVNVAGIERSIGEMVVMVGLQV